MAKRFEAVYEDGVLKPVEPLELEEHQHVRVVVLEGDEEDEEELEFVDPKEFEPFADHSVTLEMVREALSKIPGSMDADFYAERNER